MSFLFVDFVQFHLFPHLILCARVWNSAIFGNGWHAWMGLGDIFGFFQFGGVCPSGWAHTLYVTHATGTPMHDLVRNGIALSPLLSPYCYLPNENTDTRYFCFCGPLHFSAVLFHLLPFGPSQYYVSFSFSPFYFIYFFGGGQQHLPVLTMSLLPFQERAGRSNILDSKLED